MSERTENHICAHCGAKLLRVEVSDANWAGLECDNPECVSVENRRLRAENERLKGAINWVCGAGDSDFGENRRPDKDGKVAPFWWRTELQERAGLTWDRDRGVYV